MNDGRLGYIALIFLSFDKLTMGFLKKLPQLPTDLWSGNLDCLIFITSSEITFNESSELDKFSFKSS